VVAKNWRSVLSAPYGGRVARPRENSNAGRIAATRRKGRGPAADRPERAAPRGKARGGPKGRGAAPPSAFAKAMKLALLIAFMAALGFAVVLVVDVSMKVLGGVKVGDLTFSQLVDKVQARVFDHDVPEPAKKAPPKAKAPATPRASSTPPAPVARAPIAAPSPETWAKEAETRPDPEVEQARARLDQLLKGI
jgi:hypothetical protein